MRQPYKVGVVIPARNAIRTIETLLDTIDAQTYRCFAYVCDDASDDGMTKFLLDRRTWYRGYVRNEEQMGWPTSTNLAAKLAIDDGCDVLQIAAADDFLRLDAIERLVDRLPRNHFVLPVNQQVGGEGVKQVSESNATLEMFCQPWGLHEGPWPPLIDKAMIRSEVWQAVGGYSTDITIPERPWGCAEDWDFWIKVFKAGFNRYEVIREPVYYYVMHDGQLGRNRHLVHDQTLKVLKEKHHDLPWKDQADD